MAFDVDTLTARAAMELLESVRASVPLVPVAVADTGSTPREASPPVATQMSTERLESTASSPVVSKTSGAMTTVRRYVVDTSPMHRLGEVRPAIRRSRALAAWATAEAANAAVRPAR